MVGDAGDRGNDRADAGSQSIARDSGWLDDLLRLLSFGGAALVAIHAFAFWFIARALRPFPHIAEGGGYTTQFIVIRGVSGQANSGVLRFFNEQGNPLNVTLADR